MPTTRSKDRAGLFFTFANGHRCRCPLFDSHPHLCYTTRAKNRRPAPPTKSPRISISLRRFSLPVISAPPRSPLFHRASGELKTKTATTSLTSLRPCSKPFHLARRIHQRFRHRLLRPRRCFLCQQQLQPPNRPRPALRRCPTTFRLLTAVRLSHPVRPCSQPSPPPPPPARDPLGNQTSLESSLQGRQPEIPANFRNRSISPYPSRCAIGQATPNWRE